MQLDSTFSVIAPIDTVWETLMDFERVAGCVPGAQILGKLSEDAYQVGMKVKLGPVTMQYKGQLNVVERDPGQHRAVLQGQAQETRGQGTAQATVTLLLAESDGRTTGTVNADLTLSGKAAAMGKSVIGSVTEQMMTLFAANLQSLVGQPPAGPPSPAEQRPEQRPEQPSGLGAEQPAAGSTPGQAAPAPAPAAAAAETSLDASSLIKGVITSQLSSPARMLCLLAAVAVVAYRLGRRAGRRSGWAVGGRNRQPLGPGHPLPPHAHRGHALWGQAMRCHALRCRALRSHAPHGQAPAIPSSWEGGAARRCVKYWAPW